MADAHGSRSPSLLGLVAMSLFVCAGAFALLPLRGAFAILAVCILLIALGLFDAQRRKRSH